MVCFLIIFQVKLVGLEDFADKVVNFFKESIERSYPNRDKMKQLSFTEEGDTLCTVKPRKFEL